MGKEQQRPNQSIMKIIDDLKKQEATQKKTEADEKQRREDESKRVMGELGVTPIFEELRDSGRLSYGNKEHRSFLLKRRITQVIEPAIIKYSSETTGVTIFFGAISQLFDDSTRYGFRKEYTNEHRVYVEKRDDGIYVGGGFYQIHPGASYQEKRIDELKTDSKDKLPELIAKALYTVYPYIF